MLQPLEGHLQKDIQIKQIVSKMGERRYKVQYYQLQLLKKFLNINLLTNILYRTKINISSTADKYPSFFVFFIQMEYVNEIIFIVAPCILRFHLFHTPTNAPVITYII
jgi:hypothetical protein